MENNFQKVKPSIESNSDKVLTLTGHPSRDIRQILKSQVNDLIIKSTIHGIPKIILSKNSLIKLKWLILTIISSGLCVYFIIVGLNTYFEYNVTTEVRIINEHEIIFPTITICSRNYFSTENSVNFLKEVINNNSFPDIFNDDQFLLNESITSFQKINYLSDLVNLAFVNLRENADDIKKKSMSMPIQDIMITCSFGNDYCDFENDFEWIYNYYYGNCYRFNSKKDILKKSTTPGDFNGLSFEMYAGLPDQLNKFSWDKGFLLFLNSYNDFALSYIPNGIYISSNQETNILIKKFIYNQMSYPYSNCTTYQDILKLIDKNFYESFLKFNFTYTRINCMDYCYQKHLSSYCKCNSFSSGFFIDNYKSCSISEKKDCEDEFYYKIFTNLSFIEKNCADKCPLECDKTLYESSVSRSAYPTKIVRHLIQNNKNLTKKFSNQTDFKDDLEKNVLKVVIYFDSLSYIQFKESPDMNLVDLVSNIGGTLGLFLGMSLLSITEVLEILIQLILTIYSNRSN